MGGIYRGLFADALAVLHCTRADIWVVQQDTNGPFAETSRIPEDIKYRIAAVPGVREGSRLSFQTISDRAARQAVPVLPHRLRPERFRRPAGDHCRTEHPPETLRNGGRQGDEDGDRARRSASGCTTTRWWGSPARWSSVAGIRLRLREPWPMPRISSSRRDNDAIRNDRERISAECWPGSGPSRRPRQNSCSRSSPASPNRPTR